ncbi:MAG: TetR/AcrR family transcriptional regulator [Deltaproteobacteria bacterium]
MSNKIVKASTREKILEAAMKLFAAKGFNGTTTKEISEEAGVNEALIFRHFSTKRDLYGAIIEKKMQEQPSGIQATLEQYRGGEDDALLFKALAMTMFGNCGKDPTFMRILHFSALEGHDLSDMFFDTYVEQMNTLISDYIGVRIAKGAFKNLNPSMAAKAFVGMVINHIIVQELFGEKKKKNIPSEEAAEAFAEIFTNGMKNNTAPDDRTSRGPLRGGAGE